MKYVVTGVPAGVQPSAFMPNMVRLAPSGATAYKYAVTGQPGTQGIPAPTMDTVPGPSPAGQAQMGTARSGDAPDMWYPQLWFQRKLTERPGAGMPIRVYSDNMLPVPAVARTGVNALLSKRIVRRGQRQVMQSVKLPSWGTGV